MSKWSKPRQELVEIGVNLARKGYGANAVAGAITSQHFLGTDRWRASQRLARAIVALFWKRYAGRTEAQQTINEMAIALLSEGWKPLFADDDEQCFWRHQPSGQTVNSNGGYFYCYAAATRRAYESQTRALLLGAA